MKSIIVVTMAINLGAHPSLGAERKTIYFDAYPSSDDIKEALTDDVKFTELLVNCEVADVASYTSDYEVNDKFVSFECHDSEGTHIGSIVIEEHDCNSSSLVVI